MVLQKLNQVCQKYYLAAYGQDWIQKLKDLQEILKQESFQRKKIEKTEKSVPMGTEITILGRTLDKNVVAALNPFFRALLQGKMKESQVSSIKLEGSDDKSLGEVLVFLTKGYCTLSHDNCGEILRLADQYAE